MYQLLKKDVLYKGTAVLIAVLLYFYVTNLQNPIIDKNITIPIIYNNLKDGLFLGERQNSVEIKVKGPHSLVNPLVANDFKAVVDLGQAKIGEGAYPIHVTLPTGVDLVNIKFQSVNLFIDSIQDRQISVQAKIVNTAAQGYSSFDPVLTPSMVVVRGALQQLSNLENAQVIIDLNKATENLTLDLPVELIDKNGTLVTSSLDINPKTIQVFVPVIQNIPTKTVSIKPVIIGKPREGWAVSRVVIEPETIKITGSYEKLMNVDQINTKEIDITNLQDNLITQVALENPEGVELLYSPSVKVLVQVEETPVTRLYTDIPVSIENLPAGAQAVISKDKVNLTLKGSRQKLNELDKTNIKALLDLKDIGIGTHKGELKIVIPKDLQVTQVEPNTVDVTVSLVN